MSAPEVLPPSLMFGPIEAMQGVVGSDIIRLNPIGGNTYVGSNSSQAMLQFRTPYGDNSVLETNTVTLTFVFTNTSVTAAAAPTAVQLFASNIFSRLTIDQDGLVVEDIPWCQLLARLGHHMSSSDYLRYTGGILEGLDTEVGTAQSQVAAGASRQYSLRLTPSWLLHGSNKVLPLAFMSRPLTITLYLNSPNLALRVAAADSVPGYTLTNCQLVARRATLEANFVNLQRAAMSAARVGPQQEPGLEITGDMWQTTTSSIPAAATEAAVQVPVSGMIRSIFMVQQLTADQVVNAYSTEKFPSNTFAGLQYRLGADIFPPQEIAYTTTQFSDAFSNWLDAVARKDDTINNMSVTADQYGAGSTGNNAKFVVGLDTEAIAGEGSYSNNGLDTRGVSTNLVANVRWGGAAAGTLYFFCMLKVTWVLTPDGLWRRYL